MEVFNVSFPGLGINDLVINRVAVKIGSFNLYWYGILIATGLLLAVLYAYLSWEYFDVQSREKLIDCVIAGAIGGVIGARLYYVIFRWDYYSQHLGEIFNIRDGGIAIYGSIIGGLGVGLLVGKLLKQKLLPMMDITLIGFILGQAIGRWGNFFNQEAYGVETDSLFRMVSEGTGIVPVHPCFLYESVWCLLGFVFLHFFNRYFQKYHGQITFLYMIWYACERLFVEGLRTDSLYLPFSIGFYQPRVSQVLSLVLVIFGVVMLILWRKRDDGMREKNRKLRERRKEKNVSAA